MRSSYKGFEENRKTIEAQQLQQLEERFAVTNPNLKCPSSRPVVNLCTDQICLLSSGFCDDPNCEPCSQHEQCQKAKLSDISNLVQNRAQQLKLFSLQFFQIQNRMLDSAINRRKAYMDQAYKSGLEDKHLKLIESIYQKGRGLDGIKGSTIEDLEDRLRDNESYREMVFCDDPIGQFQRETAQINGQMERKQKELFEKLNEKWGAKLRPEVKTLQISKYGYYDITNSMETYSPQEKKAFGHLSITNKALSPLFRAFCIKQTQSTLVLNKAVKKQIDLAYLPWQRQMQEYRYLDKRLQDSY